MKRAIVRLFFPQRDAVDVALADLAKQGAGMARVAHACATLLVVLFSAGSLVALGTDALNAILLQWQHSHSLDVPDAISVAVSTLMVLAMDVGMVYAASMLRVLSARRAGLADRWLHIGVMAIVAALESATYWYMSVRFEHPTSSAAGALIVARALAAPLLAVYLSMARPLPITSRDILAQAEMASGGGVLRDVTAAANDRSAPLARKMKLYGASAVMTPADRVRLDSMIAAVMEEAPTSGGVFIQPAPAVALVDSQQDARSATGPDTHTVPSMPPESPHSAPGADSDTDNDRPPTGPGSPAVQPVRTPRTKATQRPAVLRLEPPAAGEPEWNEQTAALATSSRSHTSPVRTPKTKAKTPAKTTTRLSRQTVEKQARRAWEPGMSVTQLERAAGISRNAAGKWRKVLIAEAQDPQLQEQSAGDVAQ